MQTFTERSDQVETPVSQMTKETWLALAGFLTGSVASLFAFSPVLHNYFNGDDFAQLVWAYHAAKDPQMVALQFAGPWMNVATAAFYRPMASLLIYTDYMIWGANGFGFHLTNVLVHLGAAWAVFGIVLELSHRVSEPVAYRTRIWALSAACLFAIYPLHSEAVCWIVSRVDLLAGLFSNLSIWFYMRWRRNGRILSLAAALLMFALALCSKEMGVIVPAVLILFNLLFPSSEERKVERNGIASRLTMVSMLAIKNTAFFWLTLGAYFGVRLLLLKAIIGGYGNSIGQSLASPQFLATFSASLTRVLVPFNTYVVSGKSWYVSVWIACTSIAIACSLWRASRSVPNARMYMFLAGWVVVAILPALSFFNISPALQEGRLTYLLCVPLCIAATFGISNFANAKGALSRLSIGLIAAYVVSGSVLLWKNNQAWAAAGQEMLDIRLALQRQTQNVSTDKYMFFVGVPEEVKGAFAGINATSALFSRPVINQDLRMSASLSPSDWTLPFGYIRSRCFANYQDHYSVFVWNRREKRFDQIEPKTLQENREYRKELEFPALSGYVAPQSPSNLLIFDLSKSELDCWQAQVLKVRFDLKQSAERNQSGTIKVSFANNLTERSDLPVPVSYSNIDGEQEVTIALRNNPLWALGGKCSQLRLEFPKNVIASPIKLTALGSLGLIPTIDVQPSNVSTSTGSFLSLAPQSQFKIDYDTSEIPQAAGAVLEIAKPNAPFVFPNAAGPGTEVAKTYKQCGVHGSFNLNPTADLTGAVSAFRAHAIDQQGQMVGLESDSFNYQNIRLK